MSKLVKLGKNKAINIEAIIQADFVKNFAPNIKNVELKNRMGYCGLLLKYKSKEYEHSNEKFYECTEDEATAFINELTNN